MVAAGKVSEGWTGMGRPLSDHLSFLALAGGRRSLPNA